ncbi:hypothetical protein [Pantoea stewartii]|uniref:hypothetical protein n=1 Tax=Pantoea stewartii TaxID=66269 RepID=UPI00198129D5|nr:hypothetical protein [Pantoea stewartii]
MSEFKGTPGPWYRGGVENGKVSINAGNYFVALVDESLAQLANARLIAAAPELLECCLRIQAQFRQAGIESKAGSLNPIEDNAAQIDAAIIKALGQ